MIKFYKILFLLFINFAFCQTTYTGKVVGIKDGDTVVVID